MKWRLCSQTLTISWASAAARSSPCCAPLTTPSTGTLCIMNWCVFCRIRKKKGGSGTSINHNLEVIFGSGCKYGFKYSDFFLQASTVKQLKKGKKYRDQEKHEFDLKYLSRKSKCPPPNISRYLLLLFSKYPFRFGQTLVQALNFDFNADPNF